MPKDKLPKIEDKPTKERKTFQVKPSIEMKHLDVFFNYVSKNELPAGITAENKIGGIEGINSNILKNLAIWLFKKGYDEHKLKEEFKPIYDENGWAFGDLLGWFKKAAKGDITEINVGELYNWCKVYAPELQVLLHIDKVDIIELNLKDDEERDFALFCASGDDRYWVLNQFQKDHDKYAYRQKFSAILYFHSILGQILKDIYIHKEKKDNGEDQLVHPLDLRINLIMIRPSGTGKSVGLDFFNVLVNHMGLISRQPTDFTEAGLIGYAEKVKKEIVINYGIFKDSDFITFDEAQILFEKTPHKENVLTKFNVALNQLDSPSQKIYKRMREGDIEYHPHFSTNFVSVPFIGFDEKLKSGFFQRHLINIEEEVFKERIKSLKEDISRISFATSAAKREKVKQVSKEKFEYWKDIFQKFRDFAENTEFEEEEGIKQYIEQKIMPLYKMTSQIKNTEIMGIMFSFLARYLDHLYRLITHSAVIRMSKKIEKIDVDYAFSIIKKTYMSILYHIEVNSRVTYHSVQDEILNCIYTEVLVNSDSRVRSGELVKILMKKFKKSQGTIHKILNGYLDKKLLVKEDQTKGGKERIVFYKRPFKQ